MTRRNPKEDKANKDDKKSSSSCQPRLDQIRLDFPETGLASSRNASRQTTTDDGLYKLLQILEEVEQLVESSTPIVERDLTAERNTVMTLNEEDPPAQQPKEDRQ